TNPPRPLPIRWFLDIFLRSHPPLLSQGGEYRFSPTHRRFHARIFCSRFRRCLRGSLVCYTFLRSPELPLKRVGRARGESISSVFQRHLPEREQLRSKA